MDVLLFSVEDGRFGPPRLPAMLHAAGLTTAALAPEGNLLLASQWLSARRILSRKRAFGALVQALAEAVTSLCPRLIVPGDEQAVVLLQAIALGQGDRWFDPAARAIVAASLGPAAQFRASLFKSDTLALARGRGVPVPGGLTVATIAEALAFAERSGFPLYVKESFGWAGQGVTCCEDEQALRKAFAAARSGHGRWRSMARRLLARSWYPVGSAIDVQCAVAGQPAMFCALAWQGRLVAGMTGTKLELAYANGPSAAVRLAHVPELAEAAGSMIAGLGLTGFVSFDFMVPDAGGAAVLLECNPRPVAILHLGREVGVDFGALLADRLAGRAFAAPVVPTGARDVLIFPHSLDRERAARAQEAGWLVDMPADEPDLIAQVAAAAT